VAVDQFSDPGFKVLNERLQQFPEIDAYIKEATLNADENEKLASTVFAWEDRRLFRIDTPAQAALSRIYMEKQADVPRSVIAKCDKALEIFGVSLPLQEKIAHIVQDLGEYLLPHMKRFRVTSPADVKLASAAVLQNKRHMDPETRTLAAVNLTKKAVQFSTPVDTQILKMAGATMCDTRVLRDWVEARASATTDVDIRMGYEKLAESIKKMPPHCSDSDALIKVAVVLRELDEGADLVKKYDRTFMDPVTTVFNMDKVADETITVAGKQIPLDTLMNIDPDIYDDVFGADLAGEFVDSTGVINPEQLKIILPTVPRDLQQVLLSQMGGM
jgi:hypothetical protein